MQILETTPAVSMSGVNWRDAIDTVGTNDFAAATVRTLDRWAGVEHYSAFGLDDDNVTLLSAGSAHGEGTALAMGNLYTLPDFCRRDPTIAMAKRASGDGDVVLLRVDPARLDDEQLREQIYLSRDVCDRVFVCGRRSEHWYGLSMIRTRQRGSFSMDEIGCIRAMADTWLSLIAKHDRLVGSARAAEPGAALLGSVDEIEVRLRELMPTLTRRETQVCARILRGMSTPGIAIDLVLQEDSVATYRKRAYRRLTIGTRFELIQRFIGASQALTRH
jgi:DNA-binding NarL/FixJ family response regulator